MFELERAADTRKWNEALAAYRGFKTIGLNPSLEMVLVKSFGYQGFNHFLLNNGEVVGFFPCVKHRELMVSLPHFSYGGITLIDDAAHTACAEDQLVKVPYFIRSFRPFGRYSEADKVVSFIRLKSCVDAQWNHWKSKLRSQIRKGLKNDFVIHSGSTSRLLKDFYHVYTTNLRDLGSLPLPKKFFVNLLKHYDYGKLTVVCVYKSDSVAAAAIILEYQSVSEVCWASTIKKYNRLNANMVLYWEIIKLQIFDKVSIFSFGRSTVGTGSFKFKQQWGSKNRQIFLNKSNEGMNLVRKGGFIKPIFRRIPRLFSIWIGSLLSKRIY